MQMKEYFLLHIASEHYKSFKISVCSGLHVCIIFFLYVKPAQIVISFKVTECEKPPTVDLANFDDYLKLKKGASFATVVPFKGEPIS